MYGQLGMYVCSVAFLFPWLKLKQCKKLLPSSSVLPSDPSNRMVSDDDDDNDFFSFLKENGECDRCDGL
jgi:hypothetical protein